MCKQQKCNSEVGSYLAKSFYLATKTTLRMEHGCVAEPGKTLDFTEIRGYSGAHRGELIAWAVPVLANNFWKGGGGGVPCSADGAMRGTKMVMVWGGGVHFRANFRRSSLKWYNRVCSKSQWFQRVVPCKPCLRPIAW